jgi:hypothetical protein
VVDVVGVSRRQVEVLGHDVDLAGALGLLLLGLLLLLLLLFLLLLILFGGGVVLLLQLDLLLLGCLARLFSLKSGTKNVSNFYSCQTMSFRRNNLNCDCLPVK